MGGGIAQVVAASGRRVSLHDPLPGATERGLATIRKSLEKLAAKGGPPPDDVLERVTSVDADGKTLAMRWRDGRPWLTMDMATWQLTHAAPGAWFPWRWVAAVAGAATVLVLVAAVALFGRRRRPREVASVPL